MIISNYNRRTMSIDIFSEEQSDQPKMERLLNENKMKELALKKATNLIELLNIQLEVERNTSQENMRLLEQQLKNQHQHQLVSLQHKVKELQLELKRRSQTSIDHDRTIRKSVLTRANSSKSAENIRKRAFSKKYTETLPFDEPEPIVAPNVQLSLQLYRQQVLEFDEWRCGMVRELEELIKYEYDDLQMLISRIEDSSQQYRGIGSSKPKHHRNMHNQLSEIVQKQNTIINALRNYAQELEDLCKSTHFQLSSLLIKRHYNESLPKIELNDIFDKMRNVLSNSKQAWKQERSGVEAQNKQLKNIIEGLIQYVKTENKLK